MRRLFATDSSEYQELPLAVIFPADENDVREIIRWAAITSVGIIPHAAGTSLAGQCVGSGVVIDISRHLRACYPLTCRVAASGFSLGSCATNSTRPSPPTACFLVPKRPLPIVQRSALAAVSSSMSKRYLHVGSA